MNIIIGIILIGLGSWLTYIQGKKLNNGISDTLGGNISLFIVGIGLVGMGIISLFQ